MQLNELTAKQVEAARRELGEAEKCLAQGTQAVRNRYEHALLELDLAYRAHVRAEREMAWHTPGSSLASV
jgi:hypothetical protein